MDKKQILQAATAYVKIFNGADRLGRRIGIAIRNRRDRRHCR